MKKTIALLTVLVISIVAFVGAVFQFRSQLRDAYGKWDRGPVPTAISRQEAMKEAQAATNANAPAPKPTTNTNTAPTPKPAPQPAPASLPKASEAALPDTLNLSVLFVPQAPKKVWDALHEDACEEASMLMMQAYLNDVATMSLDDMDKKLADIVAYEKKTFGENAWQSTSAKDTVTVMTDFLGVKTARVVPVKSLDDVKQAIAKGVPVMLPTSGRLLKNPNFRNGGPPYHMLVAKGFTETTIITNDPGTRLGADYAYKNAVLWDAIHDWNGGDVLKGAKVMIVAE